MSSELLSKRGRGPGAGGERAPEPPLHVGEAFDPFLAGDRPERDPGARHAAWTLATMLHDPVRDLLALAERPPRALLLGAAHGWLAPQLLAWGLERVTVADPEPERLGTVRRLAAALAVEGERLSLLAEPIDEADAGWELVLLDARAGMPGRGELPAVLGGVALLAVLSDDRPADRRRLEAAGFAPVELVRPPADAERRFVKAEESLLIARHAEPGAR